MTPAMELLNELWRSRQLVGLDVVKAVANQGCSSKLTKVSEVLPSLVAGAYSFFSQRQFSEALNDSWVVIEQIIDSLWKDYVRNIGEKFRKDLLSDSRTYSVVVRMETLHTTGTIPANLHELLDKARRNRNRLAHRAKINDVMAQQCLTAMHQMIEFFCNMSVEPPMTTKGVNW